MSSATKTAAQSRIPVRKLSIAAMLSAVAFVLMFLEFPIPALIPPFIKMDFSDLPALLGAFALGPVYGIVIELVKNLLHILIKGTSSAGIGELFNFICGAVFAFVAGMIYLWRKPKSGSNLTKQEIRHKGRLAAILSSVLGALAMAVVSVPLNYFLVYPAYVVCYGMPMDAIIGMYQTILDNFDVNITANLFTCLVIFNLPFTFIKGILDALICFFIYKPLSPLLHKGAQQ